MPRGAVVGRGQAGGVRMIGTPVRVGVDPHRFSRQPPRLAVEVTAGDHAVPGDERPSGQRTDRHDLALVQGDDRPVAPDECGERRGPRRERTAKRNGVLCAQRAGPHCGGVGW